MSFACVSELSGTTILLHWSVYICYWHKQKSSIKASGNCICKQWPQQWQYWKKMDLNYVNYEPIRMKGSKCTYSKFTKVSKGLDTGGSTGGKKGLNQFGKVLGTLPELSWSNCNSCFQPLFYDFSWAASSGAAAMGKSGLCWGGSVNAQIVPTGKDRSTLPSCKGSSLAKRGARGAVGKVLFLLWCI